jgi:hypothetical protein
MPIDSDNMPKLWRGMNTDLMTKFHWRAVEGMYIDMTEDEAKERSRSGEDPDAVFKREFASYAHERARD